jgi:hypothetical protein
VSRLGVDVIGTWLQRRRAGSVVLVDLRRGGSVLQRVTLGARVSARVHVAGLDRALAGGAVPESDVALTLHARRLISPTMRRQLAHVLRGLVESSRRPSRPPVQWPGAQIGRAGSDLLALADRLERPEAVDARGVARVRVLLSDGGGPLHGNRDADGLVRAAREAVAALEPEGGQGYSRRGP